MRKDNPYIKLTTNLDEKKYPCGNVKPFESWVCVNEKPKCVTVTVGAGEINLSLKSLLEALEANGYTVTKKK